MALVSTLKQSLSFLSDKRLAKDLTAAFVAAVFPVDTATATRQLTADENGLTLFLSSATEFVTTLPLPQRGLQFQIICTAAPVGASYTVVTAGSANIIKGQSFPAALAAGDTGTADDTITFTDSVAVAGDRVELISDGTSWFAYAYCAAATGVVFTQAS